MTNPSNLSRDELAHLLGASTSSDILAAAPKKPPSSHNIRRHGNNEEEEDVSNMDSRQAAALVARSFDTKNHKTKGAVKRYRVVDKKREYHALAGDMEAPPQPAMDGMMAEPQEEEEDAFAARKRKKTEATVIRRIDRSSSSDSESSSDSSRTAPSRRRRRRGSSSSDDSADSRRRRAREKRRGRMEEDEENVVVVPHDEREDPMARRVEQQRKNEDGGSNLEIDQNANEEQLQRRGNITGQSAKKDESNSETKDNQDDGSDSDSSASSSSSDESLEPPPPQTLTKPLFVPKSRRGIVARQETERRKSQEAERREAERKRKKVLQSRALVAEAVAEKGSSAMSASVIGDEDEFEGGGVDHDVPDDNDDTDDPEKLQKERDAWEVRELIRILHEADVEEQKWKEKLEMETRRKMTDGELHDSRLRQPGEAPSRSRNKDEKKGKYLQRFHHRGAFYMDEDTLNNAGDDDVRHKALEYSRAATGEDKIDKSALPEVMQVKKFGFAGYSTKYKGLAKEDTTDKSMDFVPIVRGKKKKGA